jgi:hypothetical protein
MTHGGIQKVTSSGRVAESWHGAIAEIESRMNDSCRNLVIRGGRYDLRIPDYVVSALNLDLILKPITDRLKTIMVIFPNNFFYLSYVYDQILYRVYHHLKFALTI